MSVPSGARCVIVGGGVIGSSVAYHLSKLWKGAEIILLEAQKVTSGTTWHAAGLVGATRNTASETKLSMVGTQLYTQLLDETGFDPGYKNSGSVNVARTAERMEVFHRTANKAKLFGMEATILTPEEVHTEFLSPKDGECAISINGVVGGIKLPGDGSGSPTDLTMALLAGAKQRGVKVFEGVRVQDFERNADNAVSAVVTEKHGTIEADTVVLCAGQWSRQIGRKAGVNVPLHSAEHFYATTKSLPGFYHGTPVCRDPDAEIYFREWGDGCLFGGFELNAKPWGGDATGGVPEDFEFALLDDDWDHFYPLFENAMERIPQLETAQLKLLNGPESFTPDGHYILGEAPELQKFYVAAGMNSSGIASAGGAGKALAEWIDNGEPTMDLWPVDIRRFGGFSSNPAYLKDRTVETLGLHYTMPYPRKELKSCRNLRQSALFEELDKKGAVWGQKYGWERPNYFAGAGVDTSNTLESMYTFGQPGYLATVAEEVDACRNAVAMFDVTSFCKIAVEGKDACRLLNRLCANNVDVEPGRLVYTGMLNERGGYEADVTVTRESKDRFLIVTATAQTTRDLDWLRRNTKDEQVVVTDVTGGTCVLSVMGPRSRELLQRCTAFPDALSNDAFPFGTSGPLDVGYTNVTAKRVTYVGELGYELYIPTESARVVYKCLHDNGQDLGLRDAGYYAVDALRLEKGYRAWGHELSPDDTPLEAGLGFAVDLRSGKDFIGKDALVRQKEAGPLTKRLFSVTVVDNPDVMLWGGEVILLDGEHVGDLASGTFSPTVNAGVGLGYVKHADAGARGFAKKHQGKWSLQVGSQTVPIDVAVSAPYDSKNTKIHV